MSLARRKSVCWVLLFAGAGVALYIPLILLLEGPRVLNRETSSVFVIALLLTGTSGLILRNSYRAEPADFSGFWHLSLSDLLVCVLAAGIFMAIFRTLWPEYFAPVGVFVTLTMACGFTFCMLLAARNGFTTLRLKTLCAAGYFLTGYGGLVVGLFCFFLVYSVFIPPHEALRWISELLGLRKTPAEVTFAYNTIRAGIASIPAGYLLRGAAARLRNKNG